MSDAIPLLDLFSGIGGFSLGLERSGAFRTQAFCEVDPFCRAVLDNHWPEVPIYDDVRALSAERLAADGIAVSALCGGFPCQDISLAGRGAGLEGARSGLWHEMLRLIGEIRPRWVLAENVAALRSRGLDTVLRGLAALGYDAQWHCIPAASVGAPHRRDRIWVVAYLPDAAPVFGSAQQRGEQNGNPAGRETVADTDSEGLEIGMCIRAHLAAELATAQRGCGWPAEPGICRVAHGIPHRVDRLRSLGNSLVPQIPEIIGRAIAATWLKGDLV